MSMAEGFMKTVYKEVLDMGYPDPLPGCPTPRAWAVRSDKPDLRFGYELKDLTDVLKTPSSGCSPGNIAAGGCVRVLTSGRRRLYQKRNRQAGGW